MRSGFLLVSLCFCLFLAAGTAPAKADVARRCGPFGCSYLLCNDTGDVCSHLDDQNGGDEGSPVSGGDQGSGETAHSTCDPNGSHCYPTSGPWDYHEYYRSQGYEWQGDNGHGYTGNYDKGPGFNVDQDETPDDRQSTDTGENPSGDASQSPETDENQNDVGH